MRAQAASTDGGGRGRTPRAIDRPTLFFRNVGAFAIAGVACLLPEVGPNRFWLAGILVFFCVPAAIWLERRYPMAETGWSEPLLDLTMVVTLVHLVPSMWVPALVIGLMVVQAPSVAQSETSYRIYGAFAALLTLGMTIAAVAHDVPGWEIPILCMMVLYPSVIWYSHRQTLRANEIRRRARTVEGLHLVAGGVAHDFNNMLTTALGHAEFAQEELPTDHPAREPVDEVVEATQRASLLAARLLSFSGRGHSETESLDVDAELRDLVALMRPVIPKGIALELRCSGQSSHLRGERAQLQQVVMNLILNAAEATEVRPGTVWIDVERDDAQVTIRVRDRGVGIPDALQQRIFEPFFSLKDRGSGIGLASARSVIDDLGGWIDVTSVEGEGTEVCVTVPACEAPGVPAEPPPLVARALGGRALVVDDEAPVRAVMRRMLQRLGYEVVEAADGKEALDWMQRHPADADLVVLDLRMPGMDGWSCLRALRGIRGDLPILICSGYDPDAIGERASGPGVGILPKPFRQDGLRRALQSLLAVGT